MNGFRFLLDFSEKTLSSNNKNVVLDLKDTQFFSANLCSALGAILFRLIDNGNQISFENITPRVKNSLSKNLFLPNFGWDLQKDYYSTTIKFRKFSSVQEIDFQEYLEKELLSQPDLPKMSPLLKKKISKSILEIFNNAFHHGGCNLIYSCGQYYPHLKKLDFTISDLGKTIKHNVNGFLSKKMNGSETIQWAVEEGNTTKTGNIPGGLGLSLIREFLRLNNGKIQIASSNGYWEEKKGNIFAQDFDSEFSGTIVNLGFNINDNNSYALTSEIDPDSIF